MRKELPILDSPLNANERMLYNVAVRLDRIIELLEDVIPEKQEIIIEEPALTLTEVPKSKKKKKE